MLVLTRKVGEAICIGDEIVIMVTSVAGGAVRLGVCAPDQTPIMRQELSSWSGSSEADFDADPQSPSAVS